MMISRLLSGYFVGSSVASSYSYCTISSEAYVKLKNDLGKRTDEKSSFLLRNYLFSALSLAHGTGVIISAGKFLEKVKTLRYNHVCTFVCTLTKKGYSLALFLEAFVDHC